MGYRFANPEVLHFIWLILVFIPLYVLLERKSKEKISKAFGARLTPFLTSSLSSTKKRWKLALRLLAFVFFILSLARPQKGESQEEVKSEGIELILAVDVSTSMLAEDVKPSRLSFAKRELIRLLDQLSGDKVGLVAFAGSSALLSPVSTDKSALKMFISSLTTDSVSSQGTEFSKALIEAREAFRRGGSNEESVEKNKKKKKNAALSGAVTRAVIIASDGEDNEPGALEIAKKFKNKDGVRVFTLAFGTQEGAPIPIRDPSGNLRGYKKDRAGKTVLSQTKGKVLQKIASSGGGSFYHATFGGNSIESLVSDINKLEKSQFESQMMTQYSEKYQYFLIIGFLLALLEVFLGERRAKGRLWQGRFEVEKR